MNDKKEQYLTEIKMFFLDFGVSILTEVASQVEGANQETIFLRNPVKIIPQQGQNGQLLASFMQLVFGSKKNKWEEFPLKMIVTEVTPEDFLLRDYIKAFSQKEEPKVAVIKSMPNNLKQ